MDIFEMRTDVFDLISLAIDKSTDPEIRSMEARNAELGLTREKVMQPRERRHDDAAVTHLAGRDPRAGDVGSADR